MRTLIILAACVLLAACERPITNDQIIAETKKCEKAAMIAEPIYDGANGAAIIRIQFEPKSPA